jgi:hypothetical protein
MTNRRIVTNGKRFRIEEDLSKDGSGAWVPTLLIYDTYEKAQGEIKQMEDNDGPWYPVTEKKTV